MLMRPVGRMPFSLMASGEFSTAEGGLLHEDYMNHYMYGVVFQRTFGVVFQRAILRPSVVFQRDLTLVSSTKVWRFSGCFQPGVVFQR